MAGLAVYSATEASMLRVRGWWRADWACRLFERWRRPRLKLDGALHRGPEENIGLVASGVEPSGRVRGHDCMRARPHKEEEPWECASCGSPCLF